MKSPKAPKPTAAETQLQQRQREEMARLDDEQNVRIKRGQRSRISGSIRRVANATSAYLGGQGASAGGGRVARPATPSAGSGY